MWQCFTRESLDTQIKCTFYEKSVGSSSWRCARSALRHNRPEHPDWHRPDITKGGASVHKVQTDCNVRAVKKQAGHAFSSRPDDIIAEDQPEAMRCAKGEGNTKWKADMTLPTATEFKSALSLWAHFSDRGSRNLTLVLYLE